MKFSSKKLAILIHPWCFPWFYSRILGMKNIIDDSFRIALIVVPIFAYVVGIIIESVRMQFYQ